MKMKSVVLLSGGLDSTVNLFQAKKDTEVVMALTFHYGQRAAEAEIKSASFLAKSLGIPHQVVELDFFKQWGKSSLIDRKHSVPVGKEVAIDEVAVSQRSAKSVWVPNRNGVFLNIGAGFAESLEAQWIVPGFNAEEAVTFPDNSQGFLDILSVSFSYSTANQVKAHCFTTNKSKTEIVKMGQQLGVPFGDLWPCYFSGVKWCRECESCQRTLRALAAHQIEVE